MKELKKIFCGVGNDTMLSDLDYDGRGRALVAGYSIHETSTEVPAKDKVRIPTSE